MPKWLSPGTGSLARGRDCGVEKRRSAVVRKSIVALLLVVSFSLTLTLFSTGLRPASPLQSAMEFYQQALVQERAAGDLKAAAALYERAAASAGADRALAARALIGAARSYQKVGDA